MIGVKEAAAAAERYARELYSDQEIRYLRLEEVEMSNDGRFWNITLGWTEPEPTRLPAALSSVAVLHSPQRVYKIFRVDAEKGEVRSMKIRDVR